MNCVIFMYFRFFIQLMRVIAPHSVLSLVLALAFSLLADISFRLTVNSIKVNFIKVCLACKSLSIKPSAKGINVNPNIKTISSGLLVLLVVEWKRNENSGAGFSREMPCERKDAEISSKHTAEWLRVPGFTLSLKFLITFQALKGTFPKGTTLYTRVKQKSISDGRDTWTLQPDGLQKPKTASCPAPGSDEINEWRSQENRVRWERQVVWTIVIDRIRTWIHGSTRPRVTSPGWSSMIL